MRFFPLLLILPLFVNSCNQSGKQHPHERPSVNYIDSLEAILENVEKEGILPGFAVSIFTKDHVLLQKGYGYADVEAKKAFDPNTVQMIASVSKTLVAVSVMKLVDEEKLSLDDEINTYLPFKVVHPKFPDIPITIRHLATHTSGINDGSAYNHSYVFSQKLKLEDFPKAWEKYLKTYNQNGYIPMKDFIYAVLSRDGKWYTEDNFTAFAPGTNYEYSNIGVALLAHIIEQITQTDYAAYTKALILDPLTMSKSAWTLSEVDTVNHVKYYNENYKPVPFYTVNTYPDGSLYSSVADLTKFMQEMMKGYYGESKLLSQSAFKEMMRNQIEDMDTPTGIIWDLDNTCCIGHGGNDFGIATMMFFNPDNGLGKILFTNVSVETEALSDTYYSLFGALFQYDEYLEANVKPDLKDTK